MRPHHQPAAPPVPVPPPPPYSETPTYAHPRRITWAQAAAGHAPIMGLDMHLGITGSSTPGAGPSSGGSGGGQAYRGLVPAPGRPILTTPTTARAARTSGLGRNLDGSVADEMGEEDNDDHVDPVKAVPHQPRSFFEPLQLPSPFLKAPKSRVSNFREGLKEGGRGAWAEVREGLKGPIGLTYYWTKEGGAMGALAGLGYGTTVLALCPFSASIAFLNHSSRGALRSVRSASQRKRETNRKRKEPLSVSPELVRRASLAASSRAGTVDNSLAMNRTATMDTTRSRRSRMGGLLSRVTTGRSDVASPVTPPDSSRSAQGVVEDDSDEDQREITPFSPVSVGRSGSGSAAVPGRGKHRQDSTRLEMQTKWGLAGSPTSPLIDSPLTYTRGSPSGGGGEGSGRRMGGPSQVEMDTKWGPTAERSPGLAPALGSVIAPTGSTALPWMKLDLMRTLDTHASVNNNAQAGPSGTPQLETDLKWPVISPSSDDLSGAAGGGHPQAGSAHAQYIDHTDMMASPASAPAPTPQLARPLPAVPAVDPGHKHPATLASADSYAEDETSAIEMELKWKKELARAA